MTRPTLRWTPTAIVIGFLVFLGVLEALSLYAGLVRAGRPVTLAGLLVGTLPSWIFQLSMVWPVRLLSRRARLGPGTWRRNLPFHVLGAAAFVSVTVVGATLVFKLLGRLEDQPVQTVAVRFFFALLGSQAAVYAAMVGAFHALDYLRESEQHERERARLAASLTEARLNALRSQLSPHFFFNTLNAISTFALEGRPDRVNDMVSALGDLVRASLDDRLPHQVPLARELELLDLYLDIQRIRFADWLRVEKDIGPGAAAVLVPSLVLQPLVENAIEHGGRGADGECLVRLRCALDDGSLAIEVESPGPGSGPEAGEGLRLGVGLRNTLERLGQLHPGEHEFRFGQVASRGFVVSIRIPARRAPAAAPRAGAPSAARAGPAP
jgi:hypothetical protein